MIDKQDEFKKMKDDLRRNLEGTINPNTEKPYTEEEIDEIARAQFKKKHGKNPEEKTLLNEKITYSVPITESVHDGKDFLIQGIAINETTTRNNHTFKAEELKPAAKTLRNKPLLKDHINSVDTIVGRTTQKVRFSEELRAVTFEAKVMDTEMQEKISDGRINSVSVGAIVKEIDETKKGDIILKGIEFVELSLVAIPADADAGFANNDFAMAVMAKYNSQSKQEEKSDSESEKTLKEEISMEKEHKELQEQKKLLEEELQKYKEKEAVEAKEKEIQAEVEKRLLEDKKTDLIKQIQEKHVDLKKEDLEKMTLEELKEETEKEPEGNDSDDTKGEVGGDSQDDEVSEEGYDIQIEEGSKLSISKETYDPATYSRLGRE